MKALISILMLCLLAATPAFAEPNVKVQILTAYDLVEQTVEISWTNHVVTLDGTVLSSGSSATLIFADGLTAKRGAAVTTGERLTVTPNSPEAIATIALANRTLKYEGAIEFARRNGSWIAINTLDLDAYSAAVADAETSTDSGAMLQLMTVLIRTRAIGGGPHDGAFCDRTCCMLYAGVAGKRAKAAAAATSGKVLAYKRKLCPVYFSAACGGATRPVEEAIPHAKAHPALAGASDLDGEGRAWCRDATHFAWTRSLSKMKAVELLNEYAIANSFFLPAGPLYLRRENENAPLELIAGPKTHTVPAEPFRMFLGRKYGWNILLSDRFAVKLTETGYEFHGHGFGHRVGLCQAGALARIKSGETIEAVLSHYFPGAELIAVESIEH
jgi:stage II sporulation protein D (peptidoglycan lytic transglycosylase)